MHLIHEKLNYRLVVYEFLKRTLDVLGAMLVLLLLSPVMVAIILILILVNGGNVFFVQERIGYKNQILKVIKFKSMLDLYDRNGNLLPDEARVFPFGMFLRKTSLDELPQLINILRGNLSWVGPRPLLVEYLPYYSSREITRHNVKPGLTGWAQVNGRNTLDWDQRLQMDIWYVENRSTLLDFKILLLTIKKVLIGDGVTVSKNQISPVPLNKAREK